MLSPQTDPASPFSFPFSLGAGAVPACDSLAFDCGLFETLLLWRRCFACAGFGSYCFLVQKGSSFSATNCSSGGFVSAHVRAGRDFCLSVEKRKLTRGSPLEVSSHPLCCPFANCLRLSEAGDSGIPDAGKMPSWFRVDPVRVFFETSPCSIAAMVRTKRSLNWVTLPRSPQSCSLRHAGALGPTMLQATCFLGSKPPREVG